MGTKRMTRVNELLRREIAAQIFRISSDEDFDISAVMVTHVDTSSNLRHARVYISIRDHEDDRDRMLSIIRSHRIAFQQHLNKTLSLKYTPRLSFALDTSIEKGDHVLNLISEMEQHYEAEHPEPPPSPAEG